MARLWTDRFDQRPGEPYAKCSDCGEVLQTPDDMTQHFKDTMPAGGKSHRVRTTNATREERIERAVGQLYEDALDRLIEDLFDIVRSEKSATREEITKALRGAHTDPEDAWDRALSEEDEDEE